VKTNTRLHDELFLIPPSESYTRHHFQKKEIKFLIPTLKYYDFTEKLVTIAYVLIKSDLGAEQTVVEELEKIEQVVKVETTFGDYDMIVKLEAEHTEKIREVITWNIQKLKGIRNTKTLIKKEQD
jgi:DNA-binding Lrp family transcriptional regulator